MVGSPSKKIVTNMKYLQISWEIYSTWTIIIPTLSIRSEKADIEMRVRDRHANEYTAVKRLGDKFENWVEKRDSAVQWTVSQKFIVIDIRK